MVWTIIGSILLGALVGWIANRLLTGWIAGKVMKRPGGFWRNVLLGIGGSVIGGILSRILGVQDSGWFISLIMSVAGSCLLLWLVNYLRK